MVLHPALQIKTFHTYGFACKGIFVKQDHSIKKGESVWWYESGGESLRLFTKEQLVNAPTTPKTLQELGYIGDNNAFAQTNPGIVIENPQEQLFVYSYMMDDDCFASTPYPEEDVSYYYNHSCDPNTGYRGDDLIVALRDLDSQEQVLYDYAFTETQDSSHYGMMCKCKSSKCRGFLDFLNYKDPVFIQEHYENCTTFIKAKMRENGWIHDGVVKRKCFGGEYGLVTKVLLARKTPVVVFAGKVVSGSQVVELSPRDQQMSLQVSKDLWQIPCSQNGVIMFESGDFINHSCNPNCGMFDSTTVVTMRDVAPGESLTIDYAMVNSGERVLYGDSFECECGAHNCRKLVHAEDYTVLAQKYFEFMSPFCRDKYLDLLALKKTYSGHGSDADETTASENTATDESY
jgi:hypothetical protein